MDTNPLPVVWAFDANRNMLLKTQNLTSQQIAQLQTWCDSTFGSGKVIVS